MLLARRQFLVKERVSMMKLADTYDLFDPTTGAVIGVARDEPAAWANQAPEKVLSPFGHRGRQSLLVAQREDLRHPRLTQRAV